MKQLSRFFNLTAGERRLLASALLYLIVARVGLWVLPMLVLQRRLSKMPVERDRMRGSGQYSSEQIARAIRAVGRYVPGTGNCLVQSLTTQTMLARRGSPARLRIGVIKDENGRLRAHAWVECEGRIIMGGAGASQYTALPYWEARP